MYYVDISEEYMLRLHLTLPTTNLEVDYNNLYFHDLSLNVKVDLKDTQIKGYLRRLTLKELAQFCSDSINRVFNVQVYNGLAVSRLDCFVNYACFDLQYNHVLSNNYCIYNCDLFFDRKRVPLTIYGKSIAAFSSRGNSMIIFELLGVFDDDSREGRFYLIHNNDVLDVQDIIIPNKYFTSSQDCINLLNRMKELE